jgi:hypothetical protein
LNEQMSTLSTCTSCRGFVPATAARCPNCDASAEPRRPRPLARRLLAAAGAGAVSITLMACYGAPAHYYKEPPRPQTACDPGEQDADGDGFCTPADCDDQSAAIRPQVADPDGDGVDQNCDGVDGVAPDTSVRAAPE